MRLALSWVVSVFLLIALLASVGQAADGDSPRQPSFLVILCDDLGYGDPACFGNKTIKTPCLNKLASEGMRLTACYAAAPVCSPSRAGMLTGRVPNRVGVYDWIPHNSRMHLRRNEITVAALLKEVGYDTCHTGKWHLNGKFNSAEQTQPVDHGFNHWFSTQNNALPCHFNPVNFVRNGTPVGETQGYSSSMVADEALRWLERRARKDRPFCLFVWFHEPHEPIASPEKYVKLYPQAIRPGGVLAANVHEFF